jgi:hypothetical protein
MATRRPRVSREDLRTLFIEAGRSILREEGLGAGGEALTFKRVSERVEADVGIRVTNASLIGRVWANQYDYQTDVLATVAADDSASEIAQTVEGLAPLLADLDVSTEEGRRYAMREACRLSAAANMAALGRSRDWAIWIGVWAVTAVGAATERRRRIEAALERSYLDVTERMESVYRASIDLAGFRVRPGLSIRQFTIAVAALAEGCVLRDRVDADQMNGIMRPTGRNGEEQEWTLFGLALEALAEQFFELDPGWSPPAADHARSVDDLLTA